MFSCRLLLSRTVNCWCKFQPSGHLWFCISAHWLQQSLLWSRLQANEKMIQKLDLHTAPDAKTLEMKIDPLRYQVLVFNNVLCTLHDRAILWVDRWAGLSCHLKSWLWGWAVAGAGCVQGESHLPPRTALQYPRKQSFLSLSFPLIAFILSFLANLLGMPFELLFSPASFF